MRGFVQDHCPGFILKSCQCLPAHLRLSGQKSFKHKASCGHSRNDQRADKRCRSGHGKYFDAGLRRHLYYDLPGIGYARRSGVCDQRHRLAPEHTVHQIFPLVVFIVFMIAGHGYMDIKMIQQLDAVPGIFRRDHIRFLQDADCPWRHILQITDGRCHEK